MGRLPGALQDAMYKHIKDDTLLQVTLDGLVQHMHRRINVSMNTCCKSPNQNCFTESPELVKRKHDLEARRDALLQASVKLAGISVSLAPPISAAPTSTDAAPADSSTPALTGTWGICFSKYICSSRISE